MAQKLYTASVVTVATAGTRVQVSSTDVRITDIIVTAGASNTNKIYVGDSSVSSTNGQPLGAGESLALSASNLGGNQDEFVLSDIYLDSDANGNTARVAYIARR